MQRQPINWSLWPHYDTGHFRDSELRQLAASVTCLQRVDKLLQLLSLRGVLLQLLGQLLQLLTPSFRGHVQRAEPLLDPLSRLHAEPHRLHAVTDLGKKVR